jgi:ATP-binding protein involved in chromosome partitioning
LKIITILRQIVVFLPIQDTYLYKLLEVYFKGMSKLKQEINKEKVLDALRKVQDDGTDVVSRGIISSVIVKGSSVGFAIEVDINLAREKENLRLECEKAVKSIAGVDKVTAVLTSASAGILSATLQTKPEIHPKHAVTVTTGKEIPGVKNIILVASGKGGVGKSTVAVNLARSLAKSGSKVGIADVDIYGPSVPKMMGLRGKPEVDAKNFMIPKIADNIKTVSIGYLVDESSAIIWRSSMALKAMNQLLRGVSWGEIDYLVIDMPPGTGDIQLSMAKNFTVTGAVLVSTPQDVALLDVRKAANMFRKVGVKIFGIVENMSYFQDASGKKNYIFGEGGVKKFASDERIPFLGEIPLKAEIREAGDAGVELSDSSDIDAVAENLKKEMNGN